YNLKGKVQHCIVSADYGNEEFYFNQDRVLTKAITRYGEEDYSVTVYAIKDKTLIQKNIEVYNDGELDKSVSLAHAYEIRINSQGKTITERIVNFKNELFDTYKNIYDKDNRLIKIISDNDYKKQINTIGKYKKERIENFINELFNSDMYIYDKDNRLIKIIRNNDKGISETDIVYETGDKVKIVKEVHLAGADTLKVIKR